ncbi:MAG: peptidase M61 [Ignavibacteriae bacterium]|nr:MAG: peptidase M61 [Ignavibacteriota bacterium]
MISASKENKNFRIFPLLILLNLLLINISFSQNERGNYYSYSIDLTTVYDYKLDVTLIPPVITTDETIFHLPKMVPGTYHVYDFGRFLSNFRALDADGNELAVSMVDSSSWKISNASKLAKITYTVNDTWHPEDSYNFVFEPVGTNFEKDKSFVLNTPGLYGYFDDMKSYKFDINITKPQGFYGSTALIPVSSDETTDKYEVESYYMLADSPMLYTNPDTTIVEVGGTDVLISVYSPNKKVTSKFLASHLSEILEAVREYLGGTLPVNKYAFMLYFMPFGIYNGSGNAGALEHSNSSMYFYYELDSTQAMSYIESNAAHEFFHIITPLNIHSEEVAYFDFDNPKMSKHLWLYEGITEYSADIARVREGVITRKEFLKVLRNKMNIAENFSDTLPFTVMSKDVLTKYVDEYQNVYYKGALIGACLDLKLRSLSNGKYGVRDMMNDLAAKYGKDKPFKDDELFDVITELTYPEIRTFFADYVEGNKPLPLKEYLALAGVEYAKQKRTKDISFGTLSVNVDDVTNRVVVENLDNADEFGQDMGYEEGDVINKIYGTKVTAHNFGLIVQAVMNQVKAGDILQVEVLREGKPILLMKEFYKVDVDKHNYVGFKKKPDAQQQMVRESWLASD